jgi:hypothetical protein
MKEYIKNCHGFQEENITVIMDDGKHTSPTAENIKAAYAKIVSESESGDVIFCHYSGTCGHGPAREKDVITDRMTNINLKTLASQDTVERLKTTTVTKRMATTRLLSLLIINLLDRSATTTSSRFWSLPWPKVYLPLALWIAVIREVFWISHSHLLPMANRRKWL